MINWVTIFSLINFLRGMSKRCKILNAINTTLPGVSKECTSCQKLGRISLGNLKGNEQFSFAKYKWDNQLTKWRDKWMNDWINSEHCLSEFFHFSQACKKMQLQFINDFLKTENSVKKKGERKHILYLFFFPKQCDAIVSIEANSLKFWE